MLATSRPLPARMTLTVMIASLSLLHVSRSQWRAGDGEGNRTNVLKGDRFL
jgi:hypothetical protein